MSKVYVCTGSCHGQADQPQNCGAESCERHGMPLTPMEKCERCGAVFEETQAHQCPD